MNIIKANGSNIAEIRSFVLSYRDESLFILGNLELWGLDGIFECQMIKNANYLLGCIFLFNKTHVTFLLDNPKRPGGDIIMLIYDYIKALPSYGDITVTNTHGKYLKYILPLENVVEIEFAKLDSITNISLSYNLGSVYQIKPLTRSELPAYYMAKKTIEEFGNYQDMNSAIDTFEFEKKMHNTLVCKYFNDVVGGATMESISLTSAVLLSVFTVPGHRKRGISTALIKELIRKYKTAQRVIYVFYETAALDSGKIYKKIGFVPYEKGYVYKNK